MMIQDIKYFIENYKISENSAFICVHFNACECPEYILDMINEVRLKSYLGPNANLTNSIDLEKRDTHYNHILVFTKLNLTLVGGARFFFHNKKMIGNVCDNSYIEYSYPGFHEYNINKTFVELGRTYVDKEYRKNYALWTLLLKGTLNSMVKFSTILVGLITYNQRQNSELVNKLFLSSIKNNNFSTNRFKIPKPRFECTNILSSSEELKYDIQNIKTLRDIRKLVTHVTNEEPIIPGLLKQYYQVFQTKTLGLSVGKSFNNLIEVLGYTDLTKVKESRLRSLFTEDNLALIAKARNDL